jgi:signal transduction histidine kinase
VRRVNVLINISIDLHKFVDSLQVNVFIADKDFNLVYINPYATKTLKRIEPTIWSEFRVKVEDLKGGSIHRFHRDPEKVTAILRNPTALPHQADFEFGEVTLRTTINAVWDELGQLEAYVVNWEDTTESNKCEVALNSKLKELNDTNKELLKHTRQIEQDKVELKTAHEEQDKMHAYLKIKLAELKQTNQDLESFAVIASHDLTAPVRKIINFTTALLENGEHFSENEKFLLDKILSAGKAMRILTEDILAYSRLTGHSVTFERVNLNDVMTEVVAELADQVRVTGGEVHCGPLPIIEANRVQIGQLLQNLVSNSLKYRRENIPPVIRVSSTVEEEGFIKICLQDNGVGIKDEYADLVFQPFERLNPQIEGTGMGLAICKKVVVSHGGEITVKILPDKSGSVFNIKLPERHS